MTGRRSTHCILIILVMLCLPGGVTGNQRPLSEIGKRAHLQARYAAVLQEAKLREVRAGRAYYVDPPRNRPYDSPIPISRRQLEQSLMMEFFTGRLTSVDEALDRIREKSEKHLKHMERLRRFWEQFNAKTERLYPQLRGLSLKDLDRSTWPQMQFRPLFPPEHPPDVHTHRPQEVEQAEAEHERTKALLIAGKYVEAEDAVRKILGWRPRKASYHNSLGNALQGQKKYAEAETAYREAIRLNPTDPTSHANLAGTLWNAEHKVEATDAARTARQLGMKRHWVFERLAEAESTRGRELLEQKKYGEAEAAYREAIVWDPNASFLHNNLGSALHNQKKHQEAESAYREAIRLDPNNESAHANLASSLWDLGRKDEAVKAAHLAMKLGKTEHTVFGNIAGDYSGRSVKYYAAKRYAEAEKAAREAIAFQPEVSKYRDHLGNALYSQKKFPEAEAAYREAIRLQDDNATAHANLAATLLRLRRKDEARKAAQRAIELGKKDHWVFKELGLKPRQDR